MGFNSGFKGLNHKSQFLTRYLVHNKYEKS